MTQVMHRQSVVDYNDIQTSALLTRPVRHQEAETGWKYSLNTSCFNEAGNAPGENGKSKTLCEWKASLRSDTGNTPTISG